MARNVMDAPLSSFLKCQIMSASRGWERGQRWTYYDVGYHFGQHHAERFGLDHDTILAVTSDDEATPTTTLRRVLASEEHPAGDMVNVIPRSRRRAFLEGLVDGTAAESRYRQQGGSGG